MDSIVLKLENLNLDQKPSYDSIESKIDYFYSFMCKIWKFKILRLDVEWYFDKYNKISTFRAIAWNLKNERDPIDFFWTQNNDPIPKIIELLNTIFLGYNATFFSAIFEKRTNIEIHSYSPYGPLKIK